MRELGREKSTPKRSLRLLVLVAVAAAALVSLRTGGRPEVELQADLPGIGPRTMVTAVAREPRRGLTRLEVELVQDGSSKMLERREYVPRPAWKLWGPRTSETTLEIPVGTSVTEGLERGVATVRVSAWRAGTWLRPPEAEVREIELPVRLKPPSLSVLSSQHYPTQGGAEAVVYRLGEGVTRHGVSAGDAFFPGFALPGGQPGESFALFAVPYDLPADARVRLVAVDDVGNRTERTFVDRLRPRIPTHDVIDVSDEFIERIAPEIESRTPSLAATGSLVDRYLAINRELRAENRREIAELAQGSIESFVWRGVFMPMPNAQVMARFGDRRTYRYEGREVDRQDHLGFDLASVQRAEVPAGNGGVVVAARFLGIYGNAVILDHGYGLMSLYGHLSTIEVAEGESVIRGQTIGRTGATGLAGGDHLHFGIFLHGIAIDPVEWLDLGWIENRVAAKLGHTLEAGP